MSNWVKAMGEDALAVAKPDFQLAPDDEIRVEVEYDEGYHYSSYTYEDPSFTIRVWIDHPTTLEPSTQVGYYYNDDARTFFLQLMERGSAR